MNILKQFGSVRAALVEHLGSLLPPNILVRRHIYATSAGPVLVLTLTVGMASWVAPSIEITEILFRADNIEVRIWTGAFAGKIRQVLYSDPNLLDVLERILCEAIRD